MNINKFIFFFSKLTNINISIFILKLGVFFLAFFCLHVSFKLSGHFNVWQILIYQNVADVIRNYNDKKKIFIVITPSLIQILQICIKPPHSKWHYYFK
jgi:hypothetical protein